MKLLLIMYILLLKLESSNADLLNKVECNNTPSRGCGVVWSSVLRPRTGDMLPRLVGYDVSYFIYYYWPFIYTYTLYIKLTNIKNKICFLMRDPSGADWNTMVVGSILVKNIFIFALW